MTDEQIKAVASDVAMLKRAIEEGDPKGELLIRLSDIAAAIAAMPDRYAEGAAQERARVVAWLRVKSDCAYHSHCTFRERLFWIKTALFWPENIFSGAWKGMATAIERGEHLERGG